MTNGKRYVVTKQLIERIGGRPNTCMSIDDPIKVSFLLSQN